MTGRGPAVFDRAAAAERPELIALLPGEARNLCAVGCGAGAAAAAFRRESGKARVLGIESDREDAAAARKILDRVLEEDLCAALERLAREGERFDAFLMAGTLERLEDPVRALAIAREIAAPRAVLVASVRNVGHFARVRDLLAGRFDPIPMSRNADSPLRWFDRRFFQEALEESGWAVERVEGLSEAPESNAESFLAAFAGWPCLDLDSLRTREWVAVARPEVSTGRSGRDA